MLTTQGGTFWRLACIADATLQVPSMLLLELETQQQPLHTVPWQPACHFVLPKDVHGAGCRTGVQDTMITHKYLPTNM